MSFSTYDELVIEIITWSHRDDIDLKVNTFIQMAESEMYNNETQILQIQGQERTATLTTSGQNLALPADYQSMRSIRFLIPNNDQNVYFRAPQQMLRENGTGRPKYFTVTTDIEFNRVPDQAYDVDLKYFALPTALSPANQSNEIIADNPNLYLLGALWALSIYVGESGSAGSYYVGFISAIRGANKKAKKGRYGPAPQMTVQTATP